MRRSQPQWGVIRGQRQVMRRAGARRHSLSVEGLEERCLLAAPAEGYLYVGDFTGSQVVRFDAATGEPVTPAPYLTVTGGAEGLGGTSTRLAVATGQSVINVYDVSTGADNPPLVQTIQTGAPGLRIAFSQDATKLYVATNNTYGGAGGVSEYDFATGTLLNTVSTANGSWGVAVDPINGKIYWTTGWATGSNGAVFSANPDLSNVTQVEAPGANGATGLVGICFKADGSFYVVNGGNGDPNNSFVLHYAADGTFLDRVDTTGMPSGALYNAFDCEIGPDGNLYVSSQNNADVVKFNPTTDKFVSVLVTPNSGGLSQAKTIHFSLNTAGNPAPTATTTPTTSITSATAALNATVNPQGSATSVSFVWGTDPTLNSEGDTTTAAQEIGGGTTDVPVNAALTGLTPDTTYYDRVVATSTSGTSQGSIVSFTTPSTTQAPAATTVATTSLTATAATLLGSANPNGSATTVSFIYGTDPNLATGTTTTAAQSIGDGTADVSVNARLTGLAPDTTYYDRVVAANAGGTTQGAILSFTTAPRTATMTVLVPTPNPSTVGQTITLTATVSDTAGIGPTGSVTFYDGTHILGTAPLATPSAGASIRARQTSAASASLPVMLAAGDHALHAVFGGNAVLAPSRSSMVTQHVMAAPTGDGPRVVGVARYGFHAQPTLLVVTFNEPLDPATATAQTNYTIVTIGGPGRGGKRHGHVTAVAEVDYTPGSTSLIIHPWQRLDVHNVYQLTINGTTMGGVSNTSGQLLDGAGTGVPGSDYQTLITRSSLAGPASAAVDALAATGELASAARQLGRSTARRRS